MNLRVVKISILTFLLGLLYFNLFGLLQLKWSVNLYYIWSKFCDCGVLFFLCLLFTLKSRDRWLVRPVFIVSLTRFVWILIALKFGLDLNHTWYMAALFVVEVGGAGYLFFAEQSRMNKWLERNMPL